MTMHKEFTEAIRGSEEDFLDFCREIEFTYGSWHKFFSQTLDGASPMVFLLKNNCSIFQIKTILERDPAMVWEKSLLLNMFIHLQKQYSLDNLKNMSHVGQVIDCVVEHDEGIFTRSHNAREAFIAFLLNKDLTRFNLMELNSHGLKKATMDYVKANQGKPLLESMIQCYAEHVQCDDVKNALTYKVGWLMHCALFDCPANLRYLQSLNKENFWHAAVIEKTKSINAYMELSKILPTNESEALAPSQQKRIKL